MFCLKFRDCENQSNIDKPFIIGMRFE